MPRETSTTPGPPGAKRLLPAPRTRGSTQGSPLDAVADEQVRPPELDHQARPDLEVVGVLVAPRQRVHLDEVAAHGLGERLQVGEGRDDA